MSDLAGARRGLAGAAVAAVLLVAPPATAGAQVDGDGAFRYRSPQQASPLRAAGWIGGYLALQLTVYSVTARPPDPIYDAVYTPWDKLAHGAVSFDSNVFRTNFIGHPTMGAAMYLMARGSRLPAWQSSLWTIAGSTAWELVEYNEKASINDLVVTPLVGISLGEPLFQLGAHLDRSRVGAGGALLSWLVSPFKKLNDWYDRAALDRGDPGDHLFTRAAAGGGATVAGDARTGELRLGGGWRLVRDPEYGAPGRDLRRWLDGEVTALGLDAAIAGAGVSDLRFETSALLASLYARDLDEAGRGADLVAGAGVGFELRSHRWSPSGGPDFAGFVQLPRAAAEARWLAGDVAIAARLDASLLFAGSRSFALDGLPAAVPPEELPTSQLEFGYHFGAGAGLHAALEAALGPASLLAEWRGEALWRTPERPDPVPGRDPTAQLDERWGDARVRATWRLARGLELGAEAEWRWRWSRANETTRTARDRSVALTVGWSSGR